MYVYSKALLYMFQLTGLLPVTVTYLPPLSGEIARFCRLRAFYSSCILLVLSSTSILRLCTITNNFKYSSVFWLKMTTTTSIITAVGSVLSTFFCFCISLWLTVSRVRDKIALLQKLREVDFLLQKKGPSHKTRALSYFMVLHMCVVIICSFEHNYHLLSFDAVAQLCKLTVTCALVEFMELVLSIKDRFQLLNRRIVEVVMRSQSKDLWTVALPCVETFTMPQEMIFEIPKLNEIHWNLCSIVHETSQVYGLQVVSLMVFLFTHLVFYPYYLFLRYSHNDTNNLRPVLVSANWIILYICQLYILVLPCSLTISEAGRALALVSQLMNHKMGKQVFKQLEIFAQQLLHREVNFSACGLFTLQTSIVISVASAVTTYMAIIIQFPGSSRDLQIN